MGFLVDTDVLSESCKVRPTPGVLRWLEEHDHEVHLSTVSIGEIVKGIGLLPAGRRRKQVEAWFARIERWAGSRCLAPTSEVMHVWGRLCARQEAAGRRLPVLDSLIGATALAHGLVVATRHRADYSSEVPVINPWETP
jgi:predicted nucleic acid-binding protein